MEIRRSGLCAPEKGKNWQEKRVECVRTRAEGKGRVEFTRLSTMLFFPSPSPRNF